LTPKVLSWLALFSPIPLTLVKAVLFLGKVGCWNETKVAGCSGITAGNDATGTGWIVVTSGSLAARAVVVGGLVMDVSGCFGTGGGGKFSIFGVCVGSLGVGVGWGDVWLVCRGLGLCVKPRVSEIIPSKVEAEIKMIWLVPASLTTETMVNVKKTIANAYDM